MYRTKCTPKENKKYALNFGREFSQEKSCSNNINRLNRPNYKLSVQI
jgi:hypothetical protein